MKKLRWVSLIVLLGLLGFIMPQEDKQITVAGTVSDESGNPIPGVTILEKETSNGTNSDITGKYSIRVKSNAILTFDFIGYKTEEITVKGRDTINVTLTPDIQQLEEITVSDKHVIIQKSYPVGSAAKVSKKSERRNKFRYKANGAVMRAYSSPQTSQPNWSLPASEEEFNESYAEISENGFKDPRQDPLSTFSIDVDAASYSNLRRFINNGQKPPKDAIRIEEMINYFDYDYPAPKGKEPFSINTETGKCPWNEKHQLVHIGLQGKKIKKDNLPASNLVFLIDVSGSMSSTNKLPLLKSSLKLLTKELQEQDKVAIVVYAGAAGEVLPSTSGTDKQKILDALDNLQAGGSTAGGAGIKLAYKIAKQNFIEGGNNRVILATDGDFNVGASSDKDMKNLIEEKRDYNIFLTVLGYGMGNYKDSKMEILADKGNGNYAYIDNIQEANRVMVKEFGGTLFTIAKDVKIQVEFNPAKVQAYRLVGYENRLLSPEDFNNDKKDAGELGSGHTVTALYEVIPAGVESSFKPIDELKYQKYAMPKEAIESDDLLTVKFRYKEPTGTASKLITKTIETGTNNVSKNFEWSAAVAGFGMAIRASDYLNNYSFDDNITLAQAARGVDPDGYRAEFIRLMKAYRSL